MKRCFRALIVSIAATVLAAGLGARATTHFGPSEPGAPRRGRPSLAMASYLLRHGFRSPRPTNGTTPAQLAWPFERHMLAAPGGPALEAWWIPAPVPRPRGVVVLFHGHACAKSALLGAARVFRELGFGTLLVDFRGSGGSAGDTTTLGWLEADDVAAGIRHARGLTGGPVVVYGTSMGAAAALKAVHDGAAPDALVLECPYDNLRTTARHRFDRVGPLSAPIADLLMLWGAWQLDFDPYRLNPADFAAGVSVPTYLGFGERDPWVLAEEAQRIFVALRGPKQMRAFRGARHGAYAILRPDQWRAEVDAFLRAQQI